MRGDRLKELRTQAGHSQESLAELLGIGNRQIWRYENGQTEPDGEIIARIAQELNVSSDYLLGLTDDATPYNLRDLSLKERSVVAAMRRGDLTAVLKAIVSDEPAAV